MPQKKTVEKYLLALKDIDPKKRIGAMKKLSDLACERQEHWELVILSVPEIIALLHDPSRNVRGWAARLLGRIGPPADAAVPQLVAVLDDPSVIVRECAAYALGRLGPKANSAIPMLEKTLHDPYQGVRTSAHMALRNLLHENQLSAKIYDDDKLVAYPVDNDFLDIHYSEVGWRRAQPGPGNVANLLRSGVEKFLPDDESIRVQGYLLRFKDANPKKRLEATQKLSDIVDAGNEKLNRMIVSALPGIVSLLTSDKSWQVRCWAAWLLGRLGSLGESVVPQLVTALKDRNAAVRECACEALGWLGEKAQSAIPDLEKVLHDPNRGARTSAHKALRKLQHKNDLPEKMDKDSELVARKIDEDLFDIHYYEFGYLRRAQLAGFHRASEDRGDSMNPLRLHPGDTVRITEDVYCDEADWWSYVSYIVAPKGSLGTVLSYVDEKTAYRIRIESVGRPTEYALAVEKKQGLPVHVTCEVGNLELLRPENLEKITLF